MVGKVGPGVTGQHHRLMAGGVAHVDAVQAQHRPAGGEAPGRLAELAGEDLVQTLFGEDRAGPQAPVVEVAGDDHRLVRRQPLQQAAEQGQLLPAMAFAQAQVHADGVHLARAGHVQHAVEQAALLDHADGHVEVLVVADGELAHQRVAVVAVRVDRVAAIGELRPHAVGEELVVRRLRPVVVAPGVALVGAEHFLEEHQVGAGGAHRHPQFRQDEAPVERGESLVGVDRQHLDPVYRGGAVDGHDRHGVAHARAPWRGRGDSPRLSSRWRAS